MDAIGTFGTRFRLTLKQSRWETVAVAVVSLLLLGAAAFMAFRFFSIDIPKGCQVTGWYGGPVTLGPDGVPIDQGASAACQVATTAFGDLQRSFEMNLLRLLLALFPFLAALALGAPLVAREIEQGTAPLSWALVGSRVRWLLPKMVAMALYLAATLAIVAVAAELLFAATHPGTDSHATFEEYQIRGVMVLGSGLFVFAVAVALGAILRRTLPALIVAFVGCLIVLAVGERLVQTNLLRPLASLAWDPKNPAVQNNFGPGALYIDTEYWLNGQRYYGDPNVWWMEHQSVAMPFPLDSTGKPAMPTDAAGNPDQKAIDAMIEEANRQQLNPVPVVIEGSEYWTVVLIETGLLLGTAVAAGAVSLFVVNRRRPY